MHDYVGIFICSSRVELVITFYACYSSACSNTTWTNDWVGVKLNSQVCVRFFELSDNQIAAIVQAHPSQVLVYSVFKDSIVYITASSRNESDFPSAAFAVERGLKDR